MDGDDGFRQHRLESNSTNLRLSPTQYDANTSSYDTASNADGASNSDSHTNTNSPASRHND